MLTTITTEASTLNDISGHWGNGYINKLVANGGISGYPDGTFRPNNTITKAEFVAIAIKGALNGEVKASNGDHWATGVFESASDHGVLLMNDFPEYQWDQPINRYEMAYILIRITDNIMGEFNSGTNGLAKIMVDYPEVRLQQNYKHYVEQAFMKGIVTGKTADGLYDGWANGTRAEAATMVVRMLEPTERKKVDTDVLAPTAETRIISLTDKDRPLVPKPGDIVIKSDGTRVTLKVGPAGVLGEAQNVDYYTGIVFPATGYVFRDSSLGTTSMGYFGQTYLVDKRTGEGHFREDWNKISNFYLKEAFELYGHTAKVGTIHKNYSMYD